MFKAIAAAGIAAIALAAFALPSSGSKKLAVSPILGAKFKASAGPAQAAPSQDCAGCPVVVCPKESKSDCGGCPVTACDK